ncbi:Alpha/Beta hydrolase protein [Paraphysoderma sedebokerense]|nr:Alpha/Beta hydrolase protein [Paraphysoderma sedebokerense]
MPKISLLWIAIICLTFPSYTVYGRPFNPFGAPAAEKEPALLSEDSPVLKDIKFYLPYAASSYCPVQSIVPSYTCSSCRPAIQGAQDMVKAIQNERTDTFAFIRLDSSRNTITVSFRGSKTGVNWFNNVRFNPISYTRQYSTINTTTVPPNAAVHNGMWDTFNSIKDELGQSVQEYLSRPRDSNGSSQNSTQIVLVGHSLGGALATLGGLHLRMALNLPKEQVRVITYNQPRVGNSGFADFYDSMVPNTLRVVNSNDVVPKVPTRVAQYVHIGSEVYTDIDGKVYQCFQREDPKCSVKFLNFDVAKHTILFDQTFGNCSVLPFHFLYLAFTVYGHPLDILPRAAPLEPLQLSENSQVLQDVKFYLPYAASSYCPLPSLVPSFSCSICRPAAQVPDDVVTAIESDKTDTFGFVRLDNSRNTVVVSFRGSKTEINWAKQFQFIQKSYNDQYPPEISSAIPSDSKIHSGMWDTFESIKDELAKSVQQSLLRTQAVNGSPTPTPREIVLVGHSLGGSLAIFAAMHLRMALNIPKEQIRVITYNQPRVGNSAFADFYDSMVPNTIRVVNENDGVPTLPPIFVNYLHVGSEISINLDGTVNQFFGKENTKEKIPNLLESDFKRHNVIFDQTFGNCQG